MSVIVARSLGIADAGGSSIPTISTVVPATDEQAVDSIPLSSFRTAKWLMTITDLTNDRVVAYEIFATITNGSIPTHTRYAVIGDASILHVIDVQSSGGVVELNLTNNEIVDLNVDAIRLQVN